MPLTHHRTFRVRYYECDAFGHLKQANYLRYMLETALDASAAAGYDVARYEAMGRIWLIRDTEIEVLRSLRYADVVEVKTWVQDFRRVRSRRAYELRQAGSGTLVARALTDWAFLDSTSGRPAAIPPEMKLAFYPEGPPATAPARDRFPEPPPAPPQVFRQRQRVDWRDLDQAGHVNNAVYLAYIEDCGLRMLRAQGWPLSRLAEEGFTIVARQHRIGYRLPALLDDELEVATWFSGVDAGGATAVRHSTVTRLDDAALLVRASTVHLWVDLQTGKPSPIQNAFLAELGPTIAERNLP
jgi:YbgC/YbaW family acyl-CoA thioester hydrolase